MHFFHCVHASVQIEAGAGGFSDHSQLQPADILVQNWDLGRSVGLDISIGLTAESFNFIYSGRNCWCSP